MMDLLLSLTYPVDGSGIEEISVGDGIGDEVLVAVGTGVDVLVGVKVGLEVCVLVSGRKGVLVAAGEGSSGIFRLIDGLFRFGVVPIRA